MCVHMHTCHSTHGIRTTWEWVLVPPIVFRNWNQLVSLAIRAFTWLAISGSLWSPSPALPSAPVSSHMDLYREPGPHLPPSKTTDVSNETHFLLNSQPAVWPYSAQQFPRRCPSGLPNWPWNLPGRPWNLPGASLLLLCTLFSGFVWFCLKKKFLLCSPG